MNSRRKKYLWGFAASQSMLATVPLSFLQGGFVAGMLMLVTAICMSVMNIDKLTKQP
jgi:hypothetical protein